MAKHLALLCSLMLLLSGCVKTQTLSSSGKGGENVTSQDSTAQTTGLEGVYAVEIKSPSAPGKSDDLGEALAKGFGSMLASTMELSLDGKGGFSMSLMGIPIEGKVVQEGDAIRLEPERVMGLTEEELKKQSKEDPAQKVSMDDAKMAGKVEENGDVLRLKGEKGEPLVFRRKKAAMVEDKVAAADRDFVGTWVGVEAIANKKPETDKEKQEEQLIKSMLTTMRFEFRADYTFKMRMMFEMEGTWAKEGEEIVLKPTKMMGLEGGESSGDPMRLKIDGNRLMLKGDKADEGTLIFEKR